MSARTGEGFEELAEAVAAALPRPDVEVDVVVPYQRGDLVSRVHAEGQVLTTEQNSHIGSSFAGHNELMLYLQLNVFRHTFFPES